MRKNINMILETYINEYLYIRRCFSNSWNIFIIAFFRNEICFKSNRQDSMKILLTGGNGFIGQHLQTKLHDHDLVLTSRGNMFDNSVKYFKKNEFKIIYGNRGRRINKFFRYI